MEIRIPIHSFVDQITNSSTTIYVAAGDSTIEWMKKFINSTLEAAGSEKTADDLFEFSLSVKCYCGKVYLKGSVDAETLEGNDGMCIVDEPECGEYVNYYQEEYGMGPQWELTMIPKDESKETIQISKEMLSTFCIDGWRDG